MNHNLFTETQRFRQWWLWLLVLVVSSISWWALYVQIIEGHPFGDNPAPDWVVWVIFSLMGLAFPVLLWILRLETEITPERIRIALRPIHSRHIDIKEIRSAKVREYRPLLEYGGWGIRWSPQHGWGYNASGNKGVQLTLTDGRGVLIGSQRTDELAVAINRAMSS